MSDGVVVVLGVVCLVVLAVVLCVVLVVVVIRVVVVVVLTVDKGGAGLSFVGLPVGQLCGFPPVMKVGVDWGLMPFEAQVESTWFTSTSFGELVVVVVDLDHLS